MTLRRSSVSIALLLASWGGLDVRAAEAQCTYSVPPASVSAPSTGFNGSVSVITGSSCAWTPVSSVPWITVTSGGMSGLGSFSYIVAATTAPRTGTLTVAGQTVTVTQSTGSCSYSVAPTSVSAASTGLNGSISVITGSLSAPGRSPVRCPGSRSPPAACPGSVLPTTASRRTRRAVCESARCWSAARP